MKRLGNSCVIGLIIASFVTVLILVDVKALNNKSNFKSIINKQEEVNNKQKKSSGEHELLSTVKQKLEKLEKMITDHIGEEKKQVIRKTVLIKNDKLNFDNPAPSTKKVDSSNLNSNTKLKSKYTYGPSIFVSQSKLEKIRKEHEDKESLLDFLKPFTKEFERSAFITNSLNKIHEKLQNLGRETEKITPNNLEETVDGNPSSTKQKFIKILENNLGDNIVDLTVKPIENAAAEQPEETQSHKKLPSVSTNSIATIPEKTKSVTKSPSFLTNSVAHALAPADNISDLTDSNKEGGESRPIFFDLMPNKTSESKKPVTNETSLGISKNPENIIDPTKSNKDESKKDSMVSKLASEKEKSTLDLKNKNSNITKEKVKLPLKYEGELKNTKTNLNNKDTENTSEVLGFFPIIDPQSKYQTPNHDKNNNLENLQTSNQKLNKDKKHKSLKKRQNSKKVKKQNKSLELERSETNSQDKAKKGTFKGDKKSSIDENLKSFTPVSKRLPENIKQNTTSFQELFKEVAQEEKEKEDKHVDDNILVSELPVINLN